MVEDLILNGHHEPTIDEIGAYMEGGAKKLWDELNFFVLTQFKASPKTAYSVCSGKPGWNVKYRKSGKSLCTLYPEKNGFVVLVVVLLDMAPAIEAIKDDLSEEILRLAGAAKPYNGTKWLMIPVYDESSLAGVKSLLLLKCGSGKKT